jgi:hypothetical protein
MNDTLSRSAGEAAAQVAAYMVRWEIVYTVLQGHAEGLSKDQLAERVRFVMEEKAASAAADVAHLRQELLAAAAKVALP